MKNEQGGSSNETPTVSLTTLVGTLSSWTDRFRSNKVAVVEVPAIVDKPRKKVRECTSAKCVGADLCVHKTMPAWSDTLDYPSMAAVDGYLNYGLEQPLPSVDETRARVAKLLRTGCAPEDLHRAGATAAVLGALGITIGQLVDLHGYPLERVIKGLHIRSQSDAWTLGLHWRHLARPVAFPLEVWIDHLNVTYGDLVRAFNVYYAQLRLEAHLDAIHLLALDADAAIMQATGAVRLHMAELVVDESMQRRGGIDYVIKAFGLTPKLFASMEAPTADDFQAAPLNIKRAYMELAETLLDKQLIS